MEAGSSTAVPRPIRTARGDLRCPCCGAVRPSPRSDRAFTIVDAMILVAAVAAAFVIVRPIAAEMTVRFGDAWARTLAYVVAVLVVLTPTALGLRLRAPRPSPRRLWRQPGFVASVAGSGVIVVGVLALGLLALVRLARAGVRATRVAGVPSVPNEPLWWVGVVIHFGPAVGAAVLGAWLVFWLGGLRRPSAGWLDVLGRLLGVAWIVLMVINAVIRLSSLKG